MTLGVGFSRLNSKEQTVILKRVGAWLHYRDIKNLVTGLHQDGLKQISVFSFLKVVFNNFATSSPITLRFLQVLEAKDVAVAVQLLQLPNLENVLPSLYHYSAIAGYTQFFFKLLERPAPCYTLRSSFQSAAEHGHLAIVTRMVETIPVSDLGVESAVRLAGMNGHVEIVRLLLQKSKINELTRGWTVTLAAQRGFHLVVLELLKNGPISDRDRGEALCYALDYPHEDMVKELLKQPILKVYLSGAVQKAATQGNLKVLTILLKDKQPLLPYNLQTALFWAREKGYKEIVRLLEQSKYCARLS